MIDLDAAGKLAQELRSRIQCDGGSDEGADMIDSLRREVYLLQTERGNLEARLIDAHRMLKGRVLVCSKCAARSLFSSDLL